MVKHHPKRPVLSRKVIIDWSMLLLSFTWFCILITELVYGLSPILHGLGTGIWILFIIYFLVYLLRVKERSEFLKRNWVFALAILVPILRLIPILQRISLVRATTATFGIQIIWIFASADQGMRRLRRALGRRGVGYALVFTLVVLFSGAAGMLSFEKDSLDPNRIESYAKALWWSAMQMTNIGTSYVITTWGGRAICLGISVYSVAMFGYLTALLATFLIGHDAKDPKSEIPNQKSIQDLQKEVLRLGHLIEISLKRMEDRK